MVDLLCEMRSFEWVLWLRHEVEWSVEAAGLWFGLIQSEIHPREQKKADKNLKRGLFEATVWQRNLITLWQNLYLNMQILCAKGYLKLGEKILPFLFHFSSSCIVTSPTPISQAQTSPQEPGSVIVKVHYTYTMALKVPLQTSFRDLQDNIAEKLGQPAMIVRLR